MNIRFFDENLLGQPGLCPYIDPQVDWQREIADYDVGIYTDKFCFNQPIDNTKQNYAWIIEPPIINGDNYNNIIKNYEKFKYVFSYYRNIETKINNFKFIPHGGTWLRQSELEIYPKTQLISFLFSDKQWNGYHRQRHRIYDMLKTNTNISFFGSGCNNRIPYKIEAHKDFYFSIVVENSEEEDYFTEKLLDCLLTGTIPIYLGCPTIEKYFNTTSILRFKDPEQLPEILSTLTPELYLSMLDSVKENFEKAKQYIYPEHLIQKCIETL
jgi:hypothetical protein